MPPKYGRRESTPDATESTEIVTIQIPSGERYTVHARLLAHHSKYFRAALNGAMKEATTLHFDLTEHATEFTVALYVKWLYARSTPYYTRDGAVPYSGWIGQTKYDEALGKLCMAWLLGDYLQAPEFKNLIIVLLHRGLQTGKFWCHPLLDPYPSSGDVNLNSKLHDLLVDSLAYLMREDHATATTHTERILRGLDTGTTAKLLRKLIVGTRVVRKEARDYLEKEEQQATRGTR
ncbi:hypothetical protein DL771_007459 [Monosporascus sp. 5C6A]|nr:hypothetical protein DL771_007459 [Monosporascus sp. 5C6A]